MRFSICWPIFGFSLALLAGCPASTKESDRGAPRMFSIQEAMNSGTAKEKVNSNIRLYFGNQSTPAVQKHLGEYTTIKRTNAFNKTADEACQRAFLSGILALQERTVKEGGNAVINIRSYYKKNLINSSTEYECEPGTLMAGITLKGEAVQLAR